MTMKPKYLSLAFALLSFGQWGASILAEQKSDMPDGARSIHNQSQGQWGEIPAVKLQPLRVLGEVDSDDEDFAFYMPADLAVDAQGRRYVLDMGNHRVQVFSADGKFLKTIGRRGQGPGEFSAPNALELDAQGNLIVCETQAARIQTISAEGKVIRTVRITEGLTGDIHLLKSGGILTSTGASGGMTMIRMNQPQDAGLPPLFKILDAGGKIKSEFGRAVDFGSPLVNQIANQVLAAVDDNDDIYCTFPFQNRIEKYSADGKLLWRADRPLGYSMEIKDRGEFKNVDRGESSHSASFKLPELARCAAGAAVDGKGRLWVATLGRQLRESERVTMMMSDGGGGPAPGKAQAKGAVDLRTTDAYKLEVYDANGVLLGSIPFTMFIDGIYIKGDRLFVLDRVRGVQFHEFKIIG